MPDGGWLRVVTTLREAREPGVLVTVARVQGHAPRDAGAKMVVGVTDQWGTIGGGNVEAVAIEHARGMLENDGRVDLTSTALSDKAPYQHGVQCCGGTMTLLFEPLPVVPAVAIFGVGHVGIELARILSRHDLDLHLIDTRPEQLTDARLACLADSVAGVHIHRLALLPEVALGELPTGTHILIMTHDHAEDLALCDAVVRSGSWGSIGLIGSAAKWSRFRQVLAENGHDVAAVARIDTPIGLAELAGKEPAVVAVSVAVTTLQRCAGPRALGQRPGTEPTRPVTARSAT